MIARHILVIALVVGTGSGFRAAHAQSDVAQSVQAFYQEWFGSAPQGPAVYASFYAADGYILPAGLPAIRGRDAIAEWLKTAQASATYATKPEGIANDELRVLAPDWVVYRSTLRGQRVPKAGGPSVPFETKYFDLLHRTTAGKWEVAYRMWNESR
jgi:ketosteroid isomerase-like protein